MKKQIIAAVAALTMTLSSLPTVTFAADTSPKPVLRYTFDGSKETADENGENDLTLFGGASITEDGNTGKGLLLDGVDGYALLPSDSMPMSNTITITAWVKINKFNTWGRVFDFGEDSNNNFFFAPYSGGAARIEMKSPYGTYTMDTTEETEKDWVHYAVTVSGGTVSYYRNGRLIQSKSSFGYMDDIRTKLNYIGKSHYDGDAYLSAVIDDFRIYDTALNRDAICDIMAEGEIAPEVLLKSYAIEDGQLITGDKIDLPKYGAIEWFENNNLGLIDVDTGTVRHNDTTKRITLTAAVDDVIQQYTVYVIGKNENPYTININAADRSKDVSDIMWGLFFEDINSAADGGLYAELVQNRSFEMDDHLYSWETNGDVKTNTENPMNENNPTYVTLGKGAKIENDGFAGMKVDLNAKYDFSMYVKGESDIKVTVANDSINLKSEQHDDWEKLTGTINSKTDTDNTLLTVENIGEKSVDIDMISLIPQDTYKGHGLRKDLMEALEEMHPKFLRFPGGCAVEGETMETAWNWKDTIGDVSERKEMINIWNPSATEPYMMTYGLGFYEYFQMCEDLGMEPVPILNCGIACQVRSGSAKDENHLVPMDELQPYIDDALDLIAFANGTDENNEWTKKRIEMGHPEPFNMKYIGIGNEQYGEIYFERYAEFAKQIHKKYPDINLVTTSGTASSGGSNDLAWNWANSNTELADLMDEHYYEAADWFRQHVYRYDNYRRDTNTKVFLGEYASKGNAWYNALSEAAFMTGLERNADVVRMASYAPMFAKYGNTQWSAANMIWFTNDDYMLTPNYYVQKLFSNNQGDYSLPTEVKMNSIENDDTLHGGVAVGTWKTQAEFKDIKVVNNNGKVLLDGIPMHERFEKWEDIKSINGEWNVSSDGIISQTSDDESCIMTIPSYIRGCTDTYDIFGEFNNYTLTLKAKKTDGKEGFLIGVCVQDVWGLVWDGEYPQSMYWANIGGWSNTASKIQQVINGSANTISNVAEQCYTSNMTIENDVWYDIRVEVTDYEIKAYVNDELACSYIKPKEYGPVYASSVYDEESGDVIVKVVNTIDSDVNVGVNVNGADIDNIAKTTVMSGDTSLENSLENKNAIVPLESKITNAGNNFTYNAPANSLSIIRLSTNGENNRTPYMSGYTDGTFRPDNTITRAETAAIIAKLSADFDENKDYADKFKDVAADKWYSGYINFAADKEYISGYNDGTFKPDSSITRAEFAAILAKARSIGPLENNKFSDVKDTHWAAQYINALNLRGIISGYEDGTFKPDNTITRAEAVTMINRVLGNNGTETAVNPFSDVSPRHWAYNEILNAAN